MGITVGIDIGGSTTKIVGIDGGKILTPMMVRASDPVASLFGAFGKFVDENSLSIADVEKVALTGVGASSVSKRIYGIPTYIVEEFRANGLGGLHLSGLDEAVIVSMGTGTAFVRAEKNGDISHIGGSGVGGGTVLGLSDHLINIRSFDVLTDLAAEGDLTQVDLTVGDISRGEIATLPPFTTASNFGKHTDLAEKADLARAVFNLVFQTIGIMAVFAAKRFGSGEAVLIGNLANIPFCREVMDALEKLHDFRFIIPEHAEHGTAVGAALAINSSEEHIAL